MNYNTASGLCLACVRQLKKETQAFIKLKCEKTVLGELTTLLPLFMAAFDLIWINETPGFFKCLLYFLGFFVRMFFMYTFY